MNLDDLLSPISSEDPCGPDLDDEDDEAYLAYVFAAEGRLPKSYYDQGSQTFFDKRSLKIKDEALRIEELLERSRDLRLVTLLARFQALHGSFKAFCDCVVLADGLVDRYWTDVHPRADIDDDEDFIMRKNRLETLDSLPTSIQPLQFAAIIRDKRLGDVILRPQLIADGVETQMPDEEVGNASAHIRALAAAGNAEAVQEAHAAIRRAVEAFAHITSVFIERAGHDMAPSFAGVVAICEYAIALIERARPDLGGGETEELDDPSTADDEGEGEEEQDETPVVDDGPVSTATSKPAAGQITTVGNARRTLGAVEAYFALNEPTSPALVLVHQSKVLIGRPLLAAMEVLMPDTVDRANITLDKSLGLEIRAGRLRSLSEDAAKSVEDEESEFEIEVSNRGQAMEWISAVESFYKEREPSSPIPLLLQKARGYINRDFTSIISDLVPRRDDD